MAAWPIVILRASVNTQMWMGVMKLILFEGTRTHKILPKVREMFVKPCACQRTKKCTQLRKIILPFPQVMHILQPLPFDLGLDEKLSG